MKVAIVHEWLTTWAGAEQVLEQMIRCFPDAELFATIDFLSDEDRARLGGRRATTTFVQRLPFARSRFWNYLPLMPLAVEQLDLSAYDLVLSSSHAFAKGVITGPDQVHVSYVHSPMRYAWDMQHEYLRNTPSMRGLTGWLARLGLHYLRLWDSRTASGVDSYAANSEFVARRIGKVYGRKATVIYPPVDVSRFRYCEDKQDYYVCASRMVQYKRMDLVVQAFATMRDKKLVVVGDGPERRRLEALRAPNIEFVGTLSSSALEACLQKARALVFAGCEDFGILPVEAQACGTPVIAFGRGGTRETVVDANLLFATGVFFHEQSVDSIKCAVLEFDRRRDQIRPESCRKNAQRFSQDRFRSEFQAHVASALAAGIPRLRWT